MSVFDKVFSYKTQEPAPKKETPVAPVPATAPEGPIKRTLGNMNTAGDIMRKYDPNVPNASAEVVENPPAPMQGQGTAQTMAPQEKMLK